MSTPMQTSPSRRRCLRVLLVGAALPAGAAFAESLPTGPAPRFEFVYEARVRLGTLQRTGLYNGNERGVMSLPGGTFEGPRLRGEVLPTTHDWPEYIGNGVRLTEAAYVFQTDDNAHLFIRVHGYRYDTAALKGPAKESEAVDPPSNALRVRVEIQAPDDSRYAWMNNNLYIGVAGPLVTSDGERFTTLRVFRVL